MEIQAGMISSTMVHRIVLKDRLGNYVLLSPGRFWIFKENDF